MQFKLLRLSFKDDGFMGKLAFCPFSIDCVIRNLL